MHKNTYRNNWRQSIWKYVFKILHTIKNEEIILWYGNETDDLDEAKNFIELVEIIKEALKISSGEIYIHYKLCW
jgi:hypothetical protein